MKKIFLAVVLLLGISSLTSCLASAPPPGGTDVISRLSYDEQETLFLGGKNLTLGMGLDELGPPDEVLRSYRGFDWLVFGTKSYQDFYAVGVKDGIVVALASSGLGFEYKGVKAGHIMKQGEKAPKIFYSDVHDHNRVHSFMISNLEEGKVKKMPLLTKETFFGEARLNFHLTNAFRVYHNLPILKWSGKAARAARLHSEDMAKNNYFEHEDLEGGYCLERMDREGIIAWIYSENIAAGYLDGFAAHCGWINSKEHRENMLEDFTDLGVGMAYEKESKYGYYLTQNFYSTKYTDDKVKP